MNPDEEWKKFEKAGVKKVRENIAKHLYRRERDQLARDWVKYHERLLLYEDSLPDERDHDESVDKANHDERHWYQKPLGIIVLGLVVLILGAFLLRALGLS